MSKIKFISEFVRQPTTIGAVVPSSPALARQIVQSAHVASAEVIVEYGPGTGVFSRRIIAAMSGDAKFGVVEINPQFAATFRGNFPGVPLLEDSAENVSMLLQQMNAQKIDSIVSGLPWAAFPETLQDTLLEAMLQVLRPGGHFATFAYLQGLAMPSGKRFYDKLCWHFSSVEKSPVIWKNLPPALVYHCIR